LAALGSGLVGERYLPTDLGAVALVDGLLEAADGVLEDLDPGMAGTSDSVSGDLAGPPTGCQAAVE